MSNYIMRLDDACEKRNIENWDKIEKMLDKYKIKPLVGIIPHCEDVMMEQYIEDNSFWERVEKWTEKGWTIALHGYNHVYSSNSGGINPVNKRSEFAGESIEVQKDKIRKGVEILREKGINPEIFFAPSHTFDLHTIDALVNESDIRIISDTIAYKPYCEYGMTFVPQQSGRVRRLPFKIVTFCYHPNTMKESDFLVLEKFLDENATSFIEFPKKIVSRKKSILDRILSFLYYARR